MENTNELTLQEIAHRILSVIEGISPNKVSARPYNINNPGSNIWWVVPSQEWPAYKYGKIGVYKENDLYRVGLYIEKGVSKTDQKGNIDKITLKEDWTWNQFIRETSDGTLSQKVDDLYKQVGKPVLIKISVSDPSFRASDNLVVERSIVYKYDGNLTSVDEEVKGMMTIYKEISSISDLNTIFADKEFEWFWLDVEILLEAKTIEEITDVAFQCVKYLGELFV